MLDIERVFQAESLAIYEFLIGDGRGCRIPAYQRPYAWDRSNIDRLLEDVTSGLADVADDPESVRFLGSIIAVKERPEPHEPRLVLGIIDGQQRLCTLLVLNVLLHEMIGGLIRSLEDRADARLDDMLESANTLRDNLSRTYQYEARLSGDVHRWYPRIIRALDDAWGRSPTAVRYSSPIARFLWAYICFSHGPTATEQFSYSALDEHSRILEGHEALISIIAALKGDLKDLALGKHPAHELPSLPELRTSPHYIAQVWNDEKAPDDFEAILEDDAKLGGQLQQLIRLTALAQFINFRMAATIVEATAEDYAFDMFEAMNTTGQPLTAFETFKPKIFEAEGAGYQNSDSQASVKRVERYLDRYDRAEARQAATSTLLIPFALMEDGRKLEKHLSQQRKYLRERYGKSADLADKRRMARSLADLATFVDAVWKPDGGKIDLLPGSELRDVTAAFCIEGLRALNHDIALAPLARFYSAYVSSGTDKRKEAADAYFAAIKAVTAFSMIWRANFAGTAGIDSAYRELMAKGGGGAPPFSRRPTSGSAVEPTVENLKTYFRWKLGKKDIDRGRWVRSASSEVAYRAGQQALIRFILLVAAHDTKPDPAKPGFLESAMNGFRPMMTPDHWQDENLNSIEHVAPQSTNAPGWPADIYEDPRTVNRLGNLILMPSVANTALSNKPWAQKKVLFKLFGASTLAEAQAALTEAQAGGYNPGKKVEKLLEDAHYLPMCASIKDFDKEWDAAWVAERSRHLADLAWQRLWPWLEASPTGTELIPGAETGAPAIASDVLVPSE
ncbi:hypothetical protein D3C71_384320 [compost metagenome]